MEKGTTTPSGVSYAASVATTGAGLWAWLGENATAIGAVGVLVGVVIGIVTCGVNWYYKHQESKRN